jgi:transcriptional regulator with XRE-family HTH domain
MIRNFLLDLRRCGWTQEAIAQKTGITQSMVGKFMRGDTQCSIKTLVKIAKAFNVSTDEVLGLTVPAEKQEESKKKRRRAPPDTVGMY